MLRKLKSSALTLVGSYDPYNKVKENNCEEKYPYRRPPILNLKTPDEIKASEDHQTRPIIIGRDLSKLPFSTGYAETVNAGKSTHNEDQAQVFVGSLERNIAGCENDKYSVQYGGRIEGEFSSIPYYYFALFDGHAGYGVSVAVSHQLHHIIHAKLMTVIDQLNPSIAQMEEITIKKVTSGGCFLSFGVPSKIIPVEQLVAGALESAFNDMDEIIGLDKNLYRMKGGCTALVALFILGKCFVANAGDSRAIICKSNLEFIKMSNDFTPETESSRIRQLAALNPEELLRAGFTAREYDRHIKTTDIGGTVFYREPFMNGYLIKTVKEEDLKVPVIMGEGKRARMFATIGVTRGFGDHELRAFHKSVPIKPFISSQPEVFIYNIEEEEILENDVLLMATDGFFYAATNEKTTEVVQFHLTQYKDQAAHKLRFMYTAQDLVYYARGKPQGKNWRMSDGSSASLDDISLFVIPLLPYQKEYVRWKKDIELTKEMNECGSSNRLSDAFGKLQLRSSPSSSPKYIHESLPSSSSEQESSLLSNREQEYCQSNIPELSCNETGVSISSVSKSLN